MGGAVLAGVRVGLSPLLSLYLWTMNCHVLLPLPSLVGRDDQEVLQVDVSLPESQSGSKAQQVGLWLNASTCGQAFLRIACRRVLGVSSFCSLLAGSPSQSLFLHHLLGELGQTPGGETHGCMERPISDWVPLEAGILELVCSEPPAI